MVTTLFRYLVQILLEKIYIFSFYFTMHFFYKIQTKAVKFCDHDVKKKQKKKKPCTKFR